MSTDRPRVAALIRVSTKEQAADDRAGMDRQRDVIQRTVDGKKLDCVGWVEINDVSGTETFNCSEVQGILNDVKTGKIDGIVLADIDRLLRPVDLEDFRILQVFQDTGAVIYSGSQEIDLSSDSGYLIGGVQALLAGHELKLIKKRMLGAKEEKRKAGKCPGSKVTLPMGVAYDRKTEKYLYSDDIWRVREAFRIIDEEGLINLTEVGKRVGIHHRTLANQLRNRLYMGYRTYTQKRGTKYGSKNGRQCDRHKISRAPSEIIDVQVITDAAVSEERFNRVQQALQAKNSHWTIRRRNDAAIHLLTGVGRCGQCGERLYCSSGKRRTGKKHSYYFCKRNYYLFKTDSGGCPLPHLRQDQLDSTVTEFVGKQLADPTVIKGILDSSLRGLHHVDDPSHNHEFNTKKAVEVLDRKNIRLLTAYENGALSLDEFKSRKQQLTDELLQQQQCAISSPITVHGYTEAEVERLAMLVVRGAVGFSRTASLLDRKITVSQLFSAILIGAEGITGFMINPHFTASCTQTGIHTRTDSSPQQA